MCTHSYTLGIALLCIAKYDRPLFQLSLATMYIVARLVKNDESFHKNCVRTSYFFCLSSILVVIMVADLKHINFMCVYVCVSKKHAT